MKDKIKIDIVSDIVCPWCYIGLKRLEKAVSESSERYSFDINFKAFQLNPHLSKEGISRNAYLETKFGSQSAVESLINTVEVSARQIGLEMNMDAIERMPNTFELHRLLWLASYEKKQYVFKKRLFKAFFTEGIDLTIKDNILELANDVGLSNAIIEAFSHKHTGSREIKEEELSIRDMGIDAVPCFIINDKYMVKGAQYPETFIKIFDELSGEAIRETHGQNCSEDQCDTTAG
ncbi:DsbA family oxidoreductase [Aureibacter tunicatorum]|uniref:DsbA family dithiol-disulfide isomerase n=1 Tax=Aureibacter tunicatorum TaxID=866807 RepID=A0AAE4BQZ9_9BACT|nr:DsbA family oxidoreductase [Aureibacter tunicatorum]MDR6237418.1 putative DsbA family dithiol-disulfide isomerase [Aureibacter tunicatorum]BDD06408.1 polyketide biosynthesis protein [Aureibacter tunicatorum]